jgi:hypothetical protein
MGLAHWSGTAHPIKSARGSLAQGPLEKISNARPAVSDSITAHRPLWRPRDRCRPWSHAAHGFTAPPRAPPDQPYPLAAMAH